MNDLIKREDAIKAISISCGTCLARGTEDCDKCSVPKLCGLISAISSADLNSEFSEWARHRFKDSVDRPSETIGKLIERMEEYRDKQLLMSDYWYGINWAINTIRVSNVADRPSGEWVRDGHHIKCNLCGTYFCDTDREGDPYPQDFCPNCGCRMKGADDE